VVPATLLNQLLLKRSIETELKKRRRDWVAKEAEVKNGIIMICIIAILALAGCSSSTSLTPTKDTASPNANAPSATASSLYTVTSATYKVTEQNSSWWRFSYTIIVKNNTNSLFLLSGTIQYLDSDGAVVDTDYIYGVNLQGNQSTTVTNSSQVDVSKAPKVASMKVTFD
jgi:uncharacterized protein YceK